MDDSAALLDAYASFDLADFVAEVEDIEASYGDDKDHRKKFIEVIVRAILAYHILPQGFELDQLTQNTTFATNLTIPDGALDQEPLRIRVGVKAIPPSVNINLFSTVVKPDLRTKNGVIHVINRPLLPPPSIFQGLFLAPGTFGAVVSFVTYISSTSLIFSRRRPLRCVLA